MKTKSPSCSAFFIPRILAGVLLCFGGVALAFFAFHNVSAQSNSDAPVVQGIYRGLAPVVKVDLSPPLSEMKLIQPGGGQKRKNEDRDIVPWKIRFAPEWDPVVQRTQSDIEIPGPLQTFNGPSNISGVAPPDPNGDVGPNHVVVMSNLSFQIFNKTGTSVFGPAANNTLWAGFGGPCQTENAGDPVVLHDQQADRWVLMQFTSAGPNFFVCMAISNTPDPTSNYIRYAIATGTNFPDYPKMAVWPDAYYISTREFSSAGPFAGVGAYALNRAQVLAGNPAAQVISMLVPPGGTPYNIGDGLLPSDWDGSTAPPAGRPNFFVGSMDNGGPYGAPQDALTLWKYTVNFANPGLSTFTLANTIPVGAFNSILGLCGGTRSCIPQPGTANRIDHLGYRQRPLHRLAYRNFGTHESLVTNQSVSAGGAPEISGIRWWELRSPNAAPVLFQEGTYAPGLTDGIHRWMGSIAMNGAGSMGLAYSASSGTVFPSVWYTGRFAADPAGQMPQGEGSIINGTGSQTGGGSRWGDYTSLTVDPVDDSTFWAVNEWLPATSTSGWVLRIGSFKLSTVPELGIVSGGYSIISAGANGVLDPGEVVTVALGIRAINTGAPGTICTTAALTGTLQATGGVTSPSGPQNYGMLCAGGPTVFRNFTFTVNPAHVCGNNLTASLAVVDGATNLGTISYILPTGSTATTNIEAFDGVVAPALPAGWTTFSSGSGTLATTVTSFPDTAPNSVFTSEAGTVGLSEVTSATYAVASAGTRVSFRNEYNTEANFDGKVMEISINGGAFADIITAGGSFVSGAYNSTMPTTFMNPLPGRAAWSGLSGGSAAAPAYITTVVTLPAAATGQNVQFKWRQGADSTVVPATNPGSRVDSIKFVLTVCGGTAPVPSAAVSRKTHGAAGPFDVPLPLVPLGGAVGIEDRTGAVAGEHQMVVTFAGPATVSGASVTAGIGNVSSFSVAGAVVTINLTGVANAQRLGVTLSGVSVGANLGSVMVPMGVLSGDTNGNGSVNAGDVGQTKAQSGAVVGAGNFRTDVNSNGSINAADVGVVKSRSGTSLPP
jgi:hypothetical protein